MSGDKDFLLLQINDALFPIGGYSHSYGLETYIQKGIVCDMASADAYIRQNIRTNLLYHELLLIRLAWEYADMDDLEALLGLGGNCRGQPQSKGNPGGQPQIRIPLFENHCRTGHFL